MRNQSAPAPSTPLSSRFPVCGAPMHGVRSPAIGSPARQPSERRGMQRWDLRSVEVKAHQPEVLHSEGEGRTSLILLPAGERLQEHQVHERAWLLVVEGEIELSDGEDIAGDPGFLAVFDPNERREVLARSDARLLLLLAPWPGDGHPSLHAA